MSSWATDSPANNRICIIDAASTAPRQRLREIWQHRELLWILSLRDVQIRYKQTFFGVAWALVQPLAMLGVFWLIFGNLPGAAIIGPVPYPLFALSALVPWQLFAHTLTHATNSLVENERLISKVYFPRILLPLAAILGGMVDFALAASLLIAACVCWGHLPGIGIVLLIPAILLALASAIGVGLLLAALNVRYRDVRYSLGLMTQLWMLGTPIAYPRSVVPSSLRPIYDMNPMAGAVELFRSAVLATPIPVGSILPAVTGAGILLAIGLWYFRRTELHFADLI